MVTTDLVTPWCCLTDSTAPAADARGPAVRAGDDCPPRPDRPPATADQGYTPGGPPRRDAYDLSRAILKSEEKRVFDFSYKQFLHFAPRCCTIFHTVQISIEQFGEWLRGISKIEGPGKLAKRLGVSRSTLYLMFKGSWPSEEVCRILGVQFAVPSEGREVKRRGKKAKI